MLSGGTTVGLVDEQDINRSIAPAAVPTHKATVIVRLGTIDVILATMPDLQLHMT